MGGPGPSLLPDPDAGGEDFEILHDLHQKCQGKGNGHSGHQLRYFRHAAGGGRPLRDFISVDEPQSAEPEKIININDVLDELIGQSVALVGKPAALMNKEDKIRAIRFLSEQGAFLVTRSGEKVAKYFGISKYTLYSYLDRSAGGQSTQDS